MHKPKLSLFPYPACGTETMVRYWWKLEETRESVAVLTLEVIKIDMGTIVYRSRKRGEKNDS